MHGFFSNHSGLIEVLRFFSIFLSFGHVMQCYTYRENIIFLAIISSHKRKLIISRKILLRIFRYYRKILAIISRVNLISWHAKDPTRLLSYKTGFGVLFCHFANVTCGV
jgi:hypothetical protein